MHDGQNVFDGPAAAFGGQSWGVHRHLQALITDGAIPPTLVVAIHNTPLRWREYVPAPAVLGLPAELDSALTADPSPQARQPLSDAYVDFIVDELKPLIDRRYRTLPGRESTFVMGSSMGGMVSLYALLRRPDAFAGAACLSTHWPVSVNYPLLVPPLDGRLAAVARRYLDWLAQALPAAGRHRLYFDHGTINLDSLYPVFQRRMDRICTDRGYRPHRDLLSLAFEGADHNERSWRERGQVPLGFLLRPAD
jgi:pimeloyl-ACP methyl ester carboxylesterase